MRRIVLVVLMVASAAALFANDAQEPPMAARSTQPRAAIFGDSVEITGTVAVVDGYLVLSSGGSTYLLGAPRAAWYADDITEGQTITVRGVMIDDPAVDADVQVSGHIAVSEAVIDGEVYDVRSRGPIATPARIASPALDDDTRRGWSNVQPSPRPIMGRGRW